MFRTPTKTDKPEGQSSDMAANTTFNIESTSKDGEGLASNSVRRSIGEWESGATSKKSPAKKAAMSKKAKSSAPRDPVSEARACVVKAKTSLGDSRNISTIIKNQVLQAIDRLYALVKEAAAERPQETGSQESTEKKEEVKNVENEELIKTLQEHKTLMKENTEKMEQLKEVIEKKTYESAVEAPVVVRNSLERTALHSVVVTSKDQDETGEELLDRIRSYANANKGWVTVERVRKAKDRKIIMGCKTEEYRKELKERLSIAADTINVEDIKNKDPLIILRDVLQSHDDEDVIEALRNQNGSIFDGLEKKEDRVEICYRRRTRNPKMCHIVARVSPKIWQRVTSVDVVYIDLQRVRVADQSPLVQCSMCLGYGHGRRFCKETLEKCSHCGGPHKKSECADWLAGAVPTCCNCLRAKAIKTDHNAFSFDCPVRSKWG